MKGVKFRYPNFARKAISFTIDDGNLELDGKFIDIVRPAGITGTFNLMGTDRKGAITDGEYREFYRGFGIANHCKEHPKSLLCIGEYKISEEPFDAKAANPEYLYKTEVEGLYHKNYGTWWGTAATSDTYIRLVDEGRCELERVFGVGSVTGFVWPFCRQEDDAIISHLEAAGYKSVRRTGTADFSIPTDKMNWCYNAIHTNLIERAEEYESLPDDGELKFFCFGVHSHDFENDCCWQVLESFAARWGRREGEFWYAPVADIFDYADATAAATVTDASVTNNSHRAIFLEHGGRKIRLEAGEIFNL